MNELTSLVDDSKFNLSIDTVFQYTVSYNYWSSTTNAYRSHKAWFVGFYDGYQNRNNKSYGYYVRCVRAGQ